MTEFEKIEDRCRNNCEMYEKCVRAAAKGQNVRCMYFGDLKKQVQSLVSEFGMCRRMYVTSSEVVRLLKKF